MIDENEARARIAAAVKVLPRDCEDVPVAETAGRLAAETCRASIALPGFDSSAMDGFAVRAVDVPSGAVELKVIGEQPAGPVRGVRIGRGEAARIFTGAPIPHGADTVVMQEDCDFQEGGGTVRIRAEANVSAGEFVRRRGGDLAEGQQIVRAGQEISPARAGALASQGIASVRCGKRPRVAILTTGDELREAASGTNLEDGMIFNSNGPMLEALIRRSGLAASITRTHAPDQPDALRAELQAASDHADVVVTVGGVSVGARDFIREAAAAASFQLDFWRVRVRPGKPFLFGVRDRAEAPALLFGLPGNPVSAFVTAILFVLPALRVAAGGDGLAPGLPRIMPRAGTDLINEGDRTHYMRGRIDAATGEFRPFPRQESHALFSLAEASALARVPARTRIARGEPVEAIAL